MLKDRPKQSRSLHRRRRTHRPRLRRTPAKRVRAWAQSSRLWRAPSITALHEALHRRLAEVQPYRVLGQFDQPYARRANVTGVLQAPVMVFWNIEKH
jgi:hypothetical protein